MPDWANIPFFTMEEGSNAYGAVFVAHWGYVYTPHGTLWSSYLKHRSSLFWLVFHVVVVAVATSGSFFPRDCLHVFWCAMCIVYFGWVCFSFIVIALVIQFSIINSPTSSKPKLLSFHSSYGLSHYIILNILICFFPAFLLFSLFVAFFSDDSVISLEKNRINWYECKVLLDDDWWLLRFLLLLYICFLPNRNKLRFPIFFVRFSFSYAAVAMFLRFCFYFPLKKKDENCYLLCCLIHVFVSFSTCIPHFRITFICYLFYLISSWLPLSEWRKKK